ncbi:3-deoxy-D-arabino-heptulosonate 7-phosphate synthase [Bordetella petrii]|nr:3-deoxy-D-arabino-heptulosonate 7-phosphate synthase [Bordetella petrii]
MPASIPPSSSSLLAQALRTVARRYRLPAALRASTDWRVSGAATALAACIEQARDAQAQAQSPAPELRRHFTEALAQLIHEAMRAGQGDPAFQAMVLRHQAAAVREYASLLAHADRDRRAIRAAVDTLAHPAQLRRLAPTPLREALGRLHAAPTCTALADTASRIRDLYATDAQPLPPTLARLLQAPALARMQRLEALEADARVRQYRALWDRNGPRQGSAAASAEGAASKQRGAVVEALAARALQALAQWLNQADAAGPPYRVVTSMRVPAALAAGAQRAKTEWDAVLLRQAAGTAPGWDVCLLVEAKASADAATTDLLRLRRGLRVLAQADPDRAYPFEAREASVLVRGASLGALAADDAGLSETILYCCDAPADAAVRLLGAASRMQLLSAPASLEFAGNLARQSHPDARDLEPVWNQLLQSPRWKPVLHQYPLLRQARELMVHPDDLLALARQGDPDQAGSGV